jgi:alpha-glucosidase
MTEKIIPHSDWWRAAAIYQIYPRSFADSNGDGIGDLPGITKHLDHVAKLGADAIWLSPFFKSPMKDFGYDVSDYCDVDPMFGTIADFKALMARAHELGLKVIIDQVLSHSAEEHPWFAESRASRDNPKADWYVWADAKDDGTPPNNWLSIFGGSAWQWDTRRCQYYMHNFLVSQPDINFHCVEVQNALLDTVKFWLDLGVDGYRLDAINFCFHDKQLRNNPGRGGAGADPTAQASNPYVWQWHKFDKSQPEAFDFLRRLRKLVDQYPNTTTIGEIGDDTGLAMVARYTEGGDKLHMGYCFDLLAVQHSGPYIRGVIEKFQLAGSVGNSGGDGGWPSWALSNHDCVRLATRWGGANPPAALLRLAPALQLSLRGSSCIYQGDELGLPEAEVAFEDLQDPYGITMWPEFKGRDGCRTPMPWNAAATDIGFSEGKAKKKPWLPISESHRALAADAQYADANSVFYHYQHLLAWRKTQPAIMQGDMALLPEHAQILAYVRSYKGERVLCSFNMSDAAVTFDLPGSYRVAKVLEESKASGATLTNADGASITFKPWGVLFARLA